MALTLPVLAADCSFQLAKVNSSGASLAGRAALV
jgi:hypothetical protein